MKNNDRQWKLKGVDSKFNNKLDDFEKEVERKVRKYKSDKEYIKTLLNAFMIENPNDIERNYRIIIDVMLELKKEYEL